MGFVGVGAGEQAAEALKGCGGWRGRRGSRRTVCGWGRMRGGIGVVGVDA